VNPLAPTTATAVLLQLNAPPGIMIMIRSSSGWLRLLGLTINGTMKRDASRFDSLVRATPILRRAARQSSLRESAQLWTLQHSTTASPGPGGRKKPERSSVATWSWAHAHVGGCRVQPAREGGWLFYDIALCDDVNMKKGVGQKGALRGGTRLIRLLYF